ncbi:hypothetical protein ASPWEDRAFT_112810 [Aspergillus wentii DTO 134E9]|uniref:INO80 complex subunit Ies4 n=1 Tax=Aspergillus wentii DTO 134E9 TaxID=1073089 RepID=A0A1L9RHE7_ASPWE|nr:uncharacterized protein ASPWEDRAFT_112810 [Aspergillus wentii DTO 134E9]KAI9925701.1 hypothetical protein MW887_005503 [Aspergillus wentii]OJJ34366.1 hypothetical protein ASPWEDRAFT_112810 [Aspergillus wentii DTO 134E9]
MPSSSSATSTANGRSSRTGTSKGTVVLKLSSDLLSRFASPADVKSKINSTDLLSSPIKKETKDMKESSPASSFADPPIPPSSVDNASDAASTPATGAASAETPRRKGVPGPKPGSKRGLNQTGEAVPKARGKPGPKKKPRLDDGNLDAAKPLPPGHKLGPKANTGAINAGLRALDRSGAPCRKWQRKPLQLKSFTGIQWQLSTWSLPKSQNPEQNGEVNATVLETGDSDSKANQSASGVPSEKSNSGDGGLTPVPQPMVEASSPAIAMTA